MFTTSDFKRGLVIQLDGAPCLIVDVTVSSPTARGANTMVKTKYRNLITGQVLEKTFRSGDKVDEADFERRGRIDRTDQRHEAARGEIGVAKMVLRRAKDVGKPQFDGLTSRQHSPPVAARQRLEQAIDRGGVLR